jgi:hypothetical protein
VSGGFSVHAYAEIIATRPLGIVIYYCIPMDGDWRKFEVYLANVKWREEDLEGTVVCACLPPFCMMVNSYIEEKRMS